MCSVRTLKVVLLLVTTVAMILTILMSYISSSALQLARDIGLFNEWNTSVIWSQRTIMQNGTLTPSGWTFTVWGVIYVYQALWLAFCWSTVCRRAYEDGPFLCDEPDLAPNGLLVWHFLSSLCNMAWVILADRVDFEQFLLIPQTCVLMATAVSLYIALASSYYALARDKKQLISRRVDYWLVVVLVQNGNSLYAGWVTIASFLNLEFLLNIYAGMDKYTSSFISLSLLIALVTCYVVLDLTVLDRCTRFVFTPHLVVMWGGAGSFVRNFQIDPTWTTSAILTMVLICLAGAALLVKLIAVCIRTVKDPIFKASSYQVKQI